MIIYDSNMANWPVLGESFVGQCQLYGSIWQEDSERQVDVVLLNSYNLPVEGFLNRWLPDRERLVTVLAAPSLSPVALESLLTAYDLFSNAGNTQLGIRARGGLLIDRCGGHPRI